MNCVKTTLFAPRVGACQCPKRDPYSGKCCLAETKRLKQVARTGKPWMPSTGARFFGPVPLAHLHRTSHPLAWMQTALTGPRRGPRSSDELASYLLRFDAWWTEVSVKP